MTPIEFCKKAARAVVLRSVHRLFHVKPYPALLVLHYLKLDIIFYVVPFFLLHNISNLKRLRHLKQKGFKPNIIYYSVESDGRFDRLAQLGSSPENTDSVWFRFPIPTVAAESIIFESYNRKGCGYYEDARMKYVQPDNDENRANYRKYIDRVLDALEAWTGKIDFFMSGSNHDRYVVEMVDVAQRRGTWWIVSEREGTGTAYTYKNEAICLANSKCVTARNFFTANEGHFYMYNESKRPSVKEVSIIGELDTDFWFHWDRKFIRKQYRKWDRYKRKVLFLTFGTRNYIESYAFPNNPEMNWCQVLKESEEEIFDFAKRHPDILVYYKMGHKEDNNPLFIQRCFDENVKNIVHLDRSFPCHELILYCDLIIGFQTTALFEAMFSDNPIFYLYWAIPSCVDKKTMMLPLADSGACTVIDSREKFASYIDRWAQGDESVSKISDEEKKRRVVTRNLMFHNSDGHVAERALAKVNELIAERRKTMASIS